MSLFSAFREAMIQEAQISLDKTGFDSKTNSAPCEPSYICHFSRVLSHLPDPKNAIEETKQTTLIQNLQGRFTWKHLYLYNRGVKTEVYVCRYMDSWDVLERSWSHYFRVPSLIGNDVIQIRKELQTFITCPIFLGFAVWLQINGNDKYFPLHINVSKFLEHT